MVINVNREREREREFLSCSKQHDMATEFGIHNKVGT